MRFSIYWLVPVLLAGSSTYFLACGQLKKLEEAQKAVEETSKAIEQGGEVTIDGKTVENLVKKYGSKLGLAFPSNLAIGSLTSMKVKVTYKPGEGIKFSVEEGDSPILEKIKQRVQKLRYDKPEDKKNLQRCELKLTFRTLSEPTCYGREFVVEGSQTYKEGYSVFVPPTLQPLENGKRGIRNGDSGVLKDYENNNACLASTSEYYIAQMSEYVDRASDIMTAILCVADAKDLDLPQKGKRLELTQALQEVAWGRNLRIRKSFIERLENANENEAHFHSVVELEIKDPDGKTRPMFIDIVNQMQITADGEVASSQEDSYKGRLIIIEKNHQATKYGIAMRYKKESETLRVDFNSAVFNPRVDVLNYVDKKKGILFFDKIQEDSKKAQLPPNPPPPRLTDDFALWQAPAPQQPVDPMFGDARVAGSLVKAMFEVNVNTGLGSFSYAWSAGPSDPASRVFVVNTRKDGEKNLGCGLAGFGEPLYSMSQQVVKPKGFACAWAQPSIHNNIFIHPAVQKQCFEYDSNQDVWNVVENKLKYSIAEDCGKSKVQEGWFYDLEEIDANKMEYGKDKYVIRAPQQQTEVEVQETNEAPSESSGG